MLFVGGFVMSLRNRFVLPFALSFLAALAGCGSSSPTATPPPTGGFTNSNLKGTYVFSTSGTDVNGAPIAIVGSFTACGCSGGTISGGTIDAGDPALSAPISLQSFSSGTYKITADGRGQAELSTSTALGTVTLDFVLASPSGGLVTEFDDNGTGSGTLDLQTSTTQSQLKSYAFELAGADGSGNSLLSAGAFSLNGSATVSGGVGDFNDSGIPYVAQALGGSVTLGSGGTNGSAQLDGALGLLSFDFYVVDATHLKFIENDGVEFLSGDAFSQTTPAIPSGTMSFTVAGITSAGAPFAGGGFMASDGNGGIMNSSNEDFVDGTTTSPAPLQFSGNYVFNGPRATLTLSGFNPGANFAAYPSSGGLLLLEVDSSGATTGAALAQSSTSLAASKGYALNLTGTNSGNNLLGTSVEVDDIAEFTAASATSNPNVTGLIDENYDPSGTPTFDEVLTGTYTAPDSSGRGTITAPSEPTINGGFGLTFYAVDGSNFLFIENDGTGQVGVGSFAVQSGTSQTPSLRHPMIRVPRLLAHGAEKRATKKK